jgi:hypothetical protein
MYEASNCTINSDICNSGDKVMTRHNIAHLIIATNLKSAVISLQKMEPIIRLEHLVAELRETHTNFRWQPGLNTVPRQHSAQSEVTAHTTKELNNILLWIPVKVVHNPRRKIMLIRECTETHVILFLIRLAFTYIGGANVRVLACLSHRYCSWFLNTRWMFSLTKDTLALTTADCISGLSVVWPLGSPILPVAPPTCNDIQCDNCTSGAGESSTNYKGGKFIINPELKRQRWLFQPILGVTWCCSFNCSVHDAAHVRNKLEKCGSGCSLF